MRLLLSADHWNTFNPYWMLGHFAFEVNCHSASVWVYLLLIGLWFLNDELIDYWFMLLLGFSRAKVFIVLHLFLLAICWGMRSFLLGWIVMIWILCDSDSLFNWWCFGCYYIWSALADCSNGSNLETLWRKYEAGSLKWLKLPLF